MNNYDKHLEDDREAFESIANQTPNELVKVWCVVSEESGEYKIEYSSENKLQACLVRVDEELYRGTDGNWYNILFGWFDKNDFDHTYTHEKFNIIQSL